MAGSKLSFSYDAIGSEILRAAWMVDHMHARAERMMADAQSRAPVYEGPDLDPHRGRYREEFHVESTDAGGIKGDRAAGIVTNSSAEAVFVEYGARAHTTVVRDSRDGRDYAIKVPEMPARHILGSAMMAAAGDE